MGSKTEILKHLDDDYDRPIRDPLWKHVYLSHPLEKALASEPFLRLTQLKQLGLAVLIYPGAVHTRASHSIGVFHLAKRIIRTLVKSNEYPDHLSLPGVKAFLCAALFHDLGHFPYTHVLEDGLEVLDHEILTGIAIEQTELADLILHEVGTDPALVAAIVDHQREYPQSPEELSFFRRLLSGVLDPDKLDYLNRDAYFCGIPYGTQDTDFIISQLIPHREYGVGLAPKGLISVEHLLFSKYLMYKSVYWHKAVRSPSAIIKKALYQALTQGAITPKDLYTKTDSQFTAMALESKFSPLNKVPLAEKPGTYLTLYERQYDEYGLFSQRIKEIKERTKTEKEIRLEIQKETGIKLDEEDIVIDVPHSVSFEVDLPIIKGNKVTPFPLAGTVFDESVVQGFTTHLKRLRLIGPAQLKGKIKNPERFFI